MSQAPQEPAATQPTAPRPSAQGGAVQPAGRRRPVAAVHRAVKAPLPWLAALIGGLYGLLGPLAWWLANSFEGWRWWGLIGMILLGPSMIVVQGGFSCVARLWGLPKDGDALLTVYVLLMAASAPLYAGVAAAVARLWRHYMGKQPARGTRVSGKDANILTGLLLAIGLILLIVAIGTAMGLSEPRPRM